MPKLLQTLALAALLAAPAVQARDGSDAGPGGAGLRLAADAPDAPRLHAASFAALAQQPVFLALQPAVQPDPLLAAPHEIGRDEAAPVLPDPVPADGIVTASAATAVPPRPIPEPNISALLLAGLAAGAWAARRRRR